MQSSARLDFFDVKGVLVRRVCESVSDDEHGRRHGSTRPRRQLCGLKTETDDGMQIGDRQGRLQAQGSLDIAAQVGRELRLGHEH